MRVVIDIDADDYAYIKVLNDGITDYHTTVKLYRAIRAGDVIPDDTGDLIDKDQFFEDFPELDVEPYMDVSVIVYSKENNK